MAWPLIKYLPEKTKFRFVALAPIFGVISLLACIASLYLTLFPLTPPCGGLNCGVDFKGGSLIEVRSDAGPADLSAIREKVGSLGLGDVQIQNFGTEQDVLIRIEEQPGGEQALELLVGHGTVLERPILRPALLRG